MEVGHRKHHSDHQNLGFGRIAVEQPDGECELVLITSLCLNNMNQLIKSLIRTFSQNKACRIDFLKKFWEQPPKVMKRPRLGDIFDQK